MAVIVLLGPGFGPEVVKRGESWSVDAEGHLFVRDAYDEEVATFARGQWGGVKRSERE